jgi:tetratricopeptide (TPR) repeat protein
MTSGKTENPTMPDSGMDPEKAYLACQALVREEKIDEAIACLEDLVRVNPGHALAYNDLGVLYYRMGDKPRSVSCYEKAVSLDPGNMNSRKNLADFYLVEQGRLQDAFKIYLSVLKDNPEDIDVLLVAGHICVAMEKPGDARIFYERVLDIEPWNFDAADRLEKLNE